MKTILVVGNGGFGIDPSGRCFMTTHTARFLIDLRNRGLRPVIVKPGVPLPDVPHGFDFAVDGSGIETCILPHGGWADRAGAFLTLLRLCRRADFIHVFFPGRLARLTALACALVGARYSLYVRGERFQERGLDAWMMRRATFALTVSPALARTIARFCPDVHTVSPMNGLTASHGADRPALTKPPRRWELLYVGSLTADKGLRELIAALALLKTRGLACRLTLVGGGLLYPHLMREAAALNTQWAEEVVTLTGPIADQDALLRAYFDAHMFVLPSHHEGFPRVLSEAMLTGLPVITTMVGGIPGRLTDGVNCLAIPVNQPTAIADAVGSLVRELPVLNRIGAEGRTTILEVLRTTRTHDALLQECIERTARR